MARSKSLKLSHEDLRLLLEGMAEIYDSGNFDRDDLTAIERLLGRLRSNLGDLNHAASKAGEPLLLSRRG